MSASKEKKAWFYVAMGSVIVSILSLFLPILKSNGINFNIIDLVSGDDEFNRYVIYAFTEYESFKWMDAKIVILLAVMAIAALICTVVGLITLQAQRPNTINFVLTLIGLIGILIPSIVAIFAVSMHKYFVYGLSLGIAPIISPIAILISIGAVIRRKNNVAEEIKREMEAKGLIYEAGDL